MLILTIRTDNPEAEIGLYNEQDQLAYKTWQAHRQLAETLHQKLAELLAQHEVTYNDLTGLVVYQGPGSFTGLRIGISVANALAFGLSVPITGQTGSDWQQAGVAALSDNKGVKQVVPEYGAPVHITQQKR